MHAWGSGASGGGGGGGGQGQGPHAAAGGPGPGWRVLRVWHWSLQCCRPTQAQRCSGGGQPPPLPPADVGAATWRHSAGRLAMSRWIAPWS